MSLIVIVDDRATNRTVFAKLAASIEPDIQVKAFGDPQEALLWIAKNPPDLVITDYKMPKMDGAIFIRNFRQIAGMQDVPVVVITVHEDRTFRLRALEAGATDFLTSPVDHHEFITRARNLLKLRKHQLALTERATNLERALEISEGNDEMFVRDSRQRLAQVIDTLPVMISAAGLEGDILFVNANQAAFAGVDSRSLIGKHVSELFGEEPGARSAALDRMVFEISKPLPSFEEDIIDRHGVGRVFFTTKSPLMDVCNRVVGVVTSSLDITSRKQTEAHLHHLAHHDALTDLPNRTLFRERMRRLITLARRGDQVFALHLIDLDGFKTVNDILGHSAGDRFIKAVAERLRKAIRDVDTLARLGGDEFAILQSNVTGSEDVAAFARRILEVVASAEGFGEASVTSTASIGIAVHPEDGADAEDMLKNADLAMYRAKAENGNRYCFYKADMNMRVRASALLDTDLKDAIANEEFVIYYQPQVSLVSGRIIGAEALLRWDRPGHGLLSPGQFLPRAEENGLIVPINEWVLRAACKQARTWHKLGLHPLRIGVNMSPVQFRARTVPLLVAKVLSETGMDPRGLDLELTESIVMDDQEAVAADLKQLSDLGVGISIDDFGTGYSSLSYVKRFPVDRLKIDQSFVRNITSNQNDLAIVRAIVTLAHSLKMEVVAEGVETPEQMVKLRDEGCDEVQGFYFGKPMTADEFEAMLVDEPDLSRKSA